MLLANSRASEAYWPVKSIVLVVSVWRAWRILSVIVRRRAAAAGSLTRPLSTFSAATSTMTARRAHATYPFRMMTINR